MAYLALTQSAHFSNIITILCTIYLVSMEYNLQWWCMEDRSCWRVASCSCCHVLFHPGTVTVRRQCNRIWFSVSWWQWHPVSEKNEKWRLLIFSFFENFCPGYIFEQNQSKNTISEQYEASRMPREHFLKVFEKMKILKIFTFFHFFTFSLFWNFSDFGHGARW